MGEDDFGVYICTASNVIQSTLYSSWFAITLTVQQLPAQSTDVSVEGNTSLSVTLGWTCGENGWYDRYFHKYLKYVKLIKSIGRIIFIFSDVLDVGDILAIVFGILFLISTTALIVSLGRAFLCKGNCMGNAPNYY